MEDGHRVLQKIIWPHIAINAPEAMYFRAHPREVWLHQTEEGMRYLPEVSASGVHTLEFSTFFGAFSLSTWCGPAAIDRITLDIRLSGKALLRVWRENGFEPRVLVTEQAIESAGGSMLVSINALHGQRGILYPQFEARGTGFQLMGLRYLTPEPPKIEPRLAVIMPTFKREAYVRRNIELLSREVLGRCSGQVELFVIDNGRTLSLKSLPGASVIPNNNYGGAGGFARGVLEGSAHETENIVR
ncbi:MAG: glycosyltransferase family 2 protein [Methylomagnum sp.]